LFSRYIYKTNKTCKKMYQWPKRRPLGFFRVVVCVNAWFVGFVVNVGFWSGAVEGRKVEGGSGVVVRAGSLNNHL
jgi:hypothetical protein